PEANAAVLQTVPDVLHAAAVDFAEQYDVVWRGTTPRRIGSVADVAQQRAHRLRQHVPELRAPPLGVELLAALAVATGHERRVVRAHDEPVGRLAAQAGHAHAPARRTHAVGVLRQLAEVLGDVESVRQLRRQHGVGRDVDAAVARLELVAAGIRVAAGAHAP